MWSLAAQNPHVYIDVGVYHCVKSSSDFLVRNNQNNSTCSPETPVRKADVILWAEDSMTNAVISERKHHHKQGLVFPLMSSNRN